MAGSIFEDARGADTVQIRRFQRPDAHYVATVPLPDGRVLVMGGVSAPLGKLD